MGVGSTGGLELEAYSSILVMRIVMLLWGDTHSNTLRAFCLESKILQNAAIWAENSVWGREGAQETLADDKLLSAPPKKYVFRESQALAHSW